MSSRAFRRLQQQKLETKDDEEEEGGDNVEEEEVTVPSVKSTKKKKKKNVKSGGNIFELLAEEDELNEVNEDEKKEEDEEEEELKVDVPVTKSKSKKKRNKKKGKSNVPDPSNNELDDIDRTVCEINELMGTPHLNGTTQETSTNNASPSVFKFKAILLVDPRNLNPVNEMKRRFGSSVVNSNRRRDPHTRRFKRVTSLVTPQENWPPYTKVGVTMTPVKTENSSFSLFVFEHQEVYRNIQYKFYDAVESMDHNNIIALLNAHPYHIDSMLQLSEIFRIQDDHRMAGELIERALFVFECAFHTLFNITQGNCRLSYKRAENRPFFLALYRHINYIGDKACYRTSLEFCKVLFGLDPVEDPLGVLLMIDYYALKAEEYNYLIQMYEEYDVTRNLSLLPNFAYSYAFAKFSVGCLDEANEALRNALITFPSLLVMLTEKCGIEIDNSIRSHRYFDPMIVHAGEAPPLNQLITLFVTRSHTLWKQPEVVDWLLENAKCVADQFDEHKREVERCLAKEEGDVLSSSAEKLMSNDGVWSSAVKIQTTCFRFSPQNVLRHILTSGMKEAVECLPLEVRSRSVMTHDPLPPQDSVIGYERPHRQAAPGQDVNMLSLFLQSLMPSYNQAPPGNANPAPQQQQGGNELQNQARAVVNEERGGPNVSGAVTDGAQRLMDVMRDLLNTMTYRNDTQPPNADAGGANDEQEEQEWED